MSGTAASEFLYRLPGRASGARPGTHRGRLPGDGVEFAGHARLLDHPDPRRVDLRASLADPFGQWLVRVQRERAAVPVRLLADVSGSMRFGRPAKLEVVATFAEALGRSAFRLGDAVELVAFDARRRDDLHVPARLARGAGVRMAAQLRDAAASREDAPARARPLRGAVSPVDTGLLDAASTQAGRPGLVFVASDFHGSLDTLDVALGRLSAAVVVPLVVWDPTEIEPPAGRGLARLHESESAAQRTLWLRPSLRARWRERVAARRAELDGVFARHGRRPFRMTGAFDADALSRYFLEEIGHAAP
jgi:hypothetical protein